jgi:hypothetical protein
MYMYMQPMLPMDAANDDAGTPKSTRRRLLTDEGEKPFICVILCDLWEQNQRIGRGRQLYIDWVQENCSRGKHGNKGTQFRTAHDEWQALVSDPSARLKRPPETASRHREGHTLSPQWSVAWPIVNALSN